MVLEIPADKLGVSRHKNILFVHNIISKPIRLVDNVYHVDERYRFVFSMSAEEYRLSLYDNDTILRASTNLSICDMMSEIIREVIDNELYNENDKLSFICNYDCSPRLHYETCIGKCVTDKILKPIIFSAHTDDDYEVIASMTDEQRKDIVAISHYFNDCVHWDDCDCDYFSFDKYLALLPHLSIDDVFDCRYVDDLIALCLPKRTKSSKNIIFLNRLYIIYGLQEDSQISN